MSTFDELLSTHRLVAILRAGDSSRFTDAAAVLYSSGVRLMEATLTTHGAPDAIAAIKRELPGDGLVGAGSVRTEEDVRVAADAGADFLVTPTTRAEVLALAAELGLPVLAGALTPTEIEHAWRLGATAVKVFPAAEAGGVAYLKAVRAPLPDVPLVPTGGVALSDVDDYLAAGAVAVAAATPLLGDALTGGSLDELAERAAAFVEATG
ncbi:bifunctional 4-hydroxy-2-oxoglutarate aldolase/2-dehydro-3-deoxy-phosphogluconate aldolase [Amycolatopsis nigrescens]|uniref:bifunctional 4-hydroxy-2-oxoglutarate aldolase/2-dehydro-3-deoxy-phosphogluconate aldolase n=1 Tax=Amycolatopsis nigrescens TaxID=381445 RepID=UPI00037E1BE8|nr:bifunctional 4-hydroxy-2-oxoglutarate aldolase/2-dehydro-3-deoxy-phosphogluconate aldolase [Amycolatopsis nigrescens]